MEIHGIAEKASKFGFILRQARDEVECFQSHGELGRAVGLSPFPMKPLKSTVRLVRYYARKLHR
jgi:hypothetical protein